MKRLRLTVALLIGCLFVPAGRAEGPAPSADPARLPSLRVIWRVPTEQRVVALTFDDGPDPIHTPAILALARARHFKATFFLVGEQVARYPEIAQEEVAEGHAVGNHTWDHHTMSVLSKHQDISEVTRCEAELDEVCGPHPHLLRPPKGLWDADTYRAALSLGYPVVLWSVELEHHLWHSPQQLAQRVIGQVRPGTIILAHDGEVDRTTDLNKTLQILPYLVDGLQQRGYRFVTVPELLALEDRSPRPAPPVETPQ